MRAATPASSPRARRCTTVRHPNDPDAGPDLWSGPASGISSHPAPPGPPDMPHLRRPRMDMSPGPRAPIWACPTFEATSGHSPNMPTARHEDWACPPVQESQERTCPPIRNPPARRLDMSPGPRVPGTDMPPGAETGHVPRCGDWVCPTARRAPARACPTFEASSGHSSNMPTPRRGDWACPPANQPEALACPACGATGGHIPNLPTPRHEKWACPPGEPVRFLRSCCFSLTKPQIQR